MDPLKFVVVHCCLGECFAPIPALQECHTSLAPASLLCEFPSGNQVDGLPLVADTVLPECNTDEDSICPAPHP